MKKINDKKFIENINKKGYKSIICKKDVINYLKRDMIAWGDIIKEEYFQSQANLLLLEEINGHVEAYEKAMDAFEGARWEVKAKRETLCKMAEAVKALGKDYLQLAKLATEGKGLAIESPVADHVHQSSERRQEEEISAMGNVDSAEPDKQRSELDKSHYLGRKPRARVRPPRNRFLANKNLPT